MSHFLKMNFDAETGFGGMALNEKREAGAPLIFRMIACCSYHPKSNRFQYAYFSGVCQLFGYGHF